MYVSLPCLDDLVVLVFGVVITSLVLWGDEKDVENYFEKRFSIILAR